MAPLTVLLQEVKTWTEKIIHATEEEEKMLRQRSKARRIQLGDSNNAYFHALVRGIQKQNSILHLIDKNGKWLTQHKNMEIEVLRFYSDLVGTTTAKLNHVDIDVIRKGSQLTEASKASLIKPFSEKEIWEALNSIGDEKTPGLDGFTVKFFKTT